MVEMFSSKGINKNETTYIVLKLIKQIEIIIFVSKLIKHIVAMEAYPGVVPGSSLECPAKHFSLSRCEPRKNIARAQL